MMAEKDTKTCPLCQTENKLDAERCSNCGALLAPVRTKTVTGPPADMVARDTMIPNIHPKPGTISFYMPIEKQPIIVVAKDKIVIGRYLKGHTETDTLKPHVDLAQYDAHLLGVSRVHAMITLIDGKYHLEDLGSRNGTWVNSVRLEAHVPKELNNGDLIRLGHFLMFIYFSGEQTQLKTNIFLVDTGQSSDLLSHQGATMSYMTKKILPYLTAITEIQRVINELMERVGSEVYIKTLDIYQKESHIDIQIDGATEAIQFVAEQVMPWKKRYTQAYHQQIATEKTIASSDPSQLTSPAATADTPIGDKPPKLTTSEFRTSYLELAQNLINQYAPSLAAELQGNYVERVLLQLRTFIESSLELTSD
jgi:hypothetical protein